MMNKPTTPAVILFADIQQSTEFGFVQTIINYNNALREFHRMVQQIVDGYMSANDLVNRIVKTVKGDECCLILLGGELATDAMHAMNLAVRLKEGWRASGFVYRARVAAKTELYPMVDLRIGIGLGEVVMEYDEWSHRDTPEGIAISEAKRIEGMADLANNTLMMVHWQIQNALPRETGIKFGGPVTLIGKGIPPTSQVPVYPVITYPAWQEIQAEVVPTIIDSKEPWQLYDRANALRSSGNQDEAIAAYRQAIEEIRKSTNKEFVEATNDLGVILLGMERYDEAIDELKRAIAASPDDPELRFNLALAYNRADRIDLSIEQYLLALEQRSEFPQAWNGLGMAYSDKGLFIQAKKALEEAARIAPEFVDTFYNFACLYTNIEQYDSALAMLERAFSKHPVKYIDLAKTDHELSKLREHRTEEFEALVKKYDNTIDRSSENVLQSRSLSTRGEVA